MSKYSVNRHNNIAISLHWLMAFLIVGMLIVGKFMVWLDETSALRFDLTQWHKTFGVLILLLSVLRLIWRVTHPSPAHPASAPAWEHFAATVSHIALYSLLFIAPITGWMMVSASPLNIDTLLFNVIPWPHISWLTNLVDSSSAEARFAQFHELASHALIALLLLHVAAALKHHLVNKDDVMTGMLPNREARTGRTMIGMLAAIILGSATAVFAYSALQSNNAPPLRAGNSAVEAVANIWGETTQIVFVESSVNAAFNADATELAELTATVTTATASSDNAQVEGSLPDTEWFDSEAHPQATFQSTDITPAGVDAFQVSGILAIKGIEIEHQFEIIITETDGQKSAQGEFVVDRSAYELGLESQPNTDYVANEVSISFEFQLDQ